MVSADPSAGWWDGDWPEARWQGEAKTRGTILWQRALGAVNLQARAVALKQKHSRTLLHHLIHSWACASSAPEDVIEHAVQRARIDKGVELSDSKLRELPASLLRVDSRVAEATKRLSLAHNRLMFLPRETFDKFCGLSNLRLFGNRLRVLPPSIGKLKHLQMLFVNDNELCILPVELGELDAMHTFHVHNNPELQRFPLEFGKLKHQTMGGHLREIKYDIASIEYPPKELGDQGLVVTCDLMTRMWEANTTGRLVLSGMGLTALPHYLCELPMSTRITELNVFQNDIQRLPPALGLLSRLHALRMDETKCVFPAQNIVKQSEGLRNAETRMVLGASRAPFMAFLRRIADCRHAREITLQGGTWSYADTAVQVELTLIAPEILAQTNCKLLDLRYNNIKEIPEAIEDMRGLTALHIDRNALRTVPDSLGRLWQLRTFTAGSNDLWKFPDILAGLSSLVTLDLQHNNLAHIPPSITAVTTLTHLSINHNRLAALPPGLNALLSLRYAYIGYNPLLSLPPELGASPFLIEVNADHTLNLSSSPPEVLNSTVPPRNPLLNPEPETVPFLVSSQRLVATLARPAVLTALAQIDLGSLVATTDAAKTAHRSSSSAASKRTVVAVSDSPEDDIVSWLVATATQTHAPVELVTALEVRAERERGSVVYEPADTVYSKKWRLGKDALVRGMDAVDVNQILAANMPHMGRSPGLVRYLWGLWVASRIGVADVRGTGMVSLHSDLLSMGWLTKLLLAHNRILTLPPEISRLTQLLTLDLGHNLITVLPALIGQLTTLRELNLRYNMLDSLPKEMALLPNWTYPRDPSAMQYFDTSWAEGNPLSFPHPHILQLGPDHTRSFLLQVSAAAKSGYLDFENRALPLFPDQLTDFGFLVNINLSYNKIDRIPPAITNMIQLEICTLSGNSIDRLPNRLSTLTSLQVLDMRDNQLIGLPEGVGNLHGSLNRLLLGRNRLVSLPATLGMLSNLEHLHLNWNLLATLPEEIGNCTGLVELQLSYNKLRHIPASFSNLTKLSSCALQNNLLELLPTCLGNMPNLAKLAFANNLWQMPQQEVLAWPPMYQKKPELRLSVGMKVWCRYQRLQRFRPARIDAVNANGTFDLSYPYDRGPLGGLDKETDVRISYVSESGAPVELIKPLSDHDRLVDFMSRIHSSAKTKELDLSAFHITEFLDYDAGAGFKYMLTSGWFTRGLRVLDLSNNRLSTLPMSISRLFSLTILDLHCNAIIGLPETISTLATLRQIDVSYNHLTVLPSGLGLAAELESITTHHNPLIAPPPEILRQEASVVTRYLCGVHLARRTGKLDWNGLGLCSMDTLVVMLSDGDASLVEELYLDDNRLTLLHPNVLYELQNLQVLRCCRNYLLSVHPNLGVFCQKLEQITLDGNRLTHVPPTLVLSLDPHRVVLLGTLTALISLSLDDNPHLISPPPEINMMPSQIKIRYLRELHRASAHHAANLSHFKLDHFPDPFTDFADLVVMDISHNALPRIHPSVRYWTSLTRLSVAHNRMSALDPNLGRCRMLIHLDVSYNLLRRLPPELGRLTRITSLHVSHQTCPPSLDINASSRGFQWSALPWRIRHVHNVSACKEYKSVPVDEILVCKDCTLAGRVTAGIYNRETCEDKSEEYESAEEVRKEKGEPSKPAPVVYCQGCASWQPVSTLLSPPELRTNNVREWLPSAFVDRAVWCPDMPQSAFEANYVSLYPARTASDLRPVPDVLETPPMTLMEQDEEGQLPMVVQYLGRCLLGRWGEVDVCGFGLPQFPLEVLDLSGLVSCFASDNSIRDLPDDLDRLSNLQALHLDHNLLELLPPGIRFLTALEDLQLNDNNLAEICPELGACTRLVKLSLHSNRLITLPHTVGSCTLLTQLTIQNNKIQVLPPSLSLAEGIVLLDLDSDPATNCFSSPPNPIPQQSTKNFLRYLREIFAYAREARLYTPGYDLDFIPDLVLEAATSVTALKLDQNNISVIPDKIGEFTLLKELLSVCDNSIQELPASVGRLTRLQVLRLSGNNLISLPYELSELVNLQELSADHNHLSEMPQCFSTMTLLQILSFSDNNVKTLHAEFGLISSITKLGLTENPITFPSAEVCARSTAEIIDFLGRLKVSQYTFSLDLAGLELTSLNHQLGDAVGAKVVHLQNNFLTALPGEFEAMSSCRELVLDGNPMQAMPDVAGLLPELEILSMVEMSGPLNAISETLGLLQNLLMLCCPDNDIFELPDVFTNLLNLEYLDIANNRVRIMPPSMAACENLKVLQLRNNVLEELFHGFSNLNLLHTLDVANNKLKRLQRGIGSLSLYHVLKNVDLSGNLWRMPPEEVCVQGEKRMLEYVGNLWKSKLANGVQIQEFKLTIIHAEILDLSNVAELNLDKNMIRKIPSEITNLKKLVEISMKENRLEVLCEEIFELKSLEVLKFDDNRLTAIPKSIARLARSLTWLGLERNHIVSLPVEMGNLEVLEIFQVTTLNLEKDTREALEHGLDTLLAYLKVWQPVKSTRRVQLNWDSNLVWEPLKEVPAQIWKYRDTLSYLFLNDNEISALPYNMCVLQRLQELHLERNTLTFLPYSLCLLSKLTVLQLVDNSNLSDPPYDLVLEAEGVRDIMRYLEALYLAPSIKCLVLNEFGLLSLKPNDMDPATMERLKFDRKRASAKLQDGSMRNTGMVEQIDRRLQLLDIEALGLDDNQFDSFPATVFRFLRLSFLSIARNRMENVAEEIGVLTSLTILHLDSNHIQRLPESFTNLQSLKKLSIPKNQIEELPDVLLSITRLRVLDLASNQMASLPAQLPQRLSRLQVLNMHDNQLTSCPNTIGKLQHVVMLDLSQNNLITVPNSIAKCSKLRALYLSDNPLPTLPHGILALTQLHQLRFARTFLTGIPPQLSAMSMLQDLDLSNNARLIWPPPDVMEQEWRIIMDFLRMHQEGDGEEKGEEGGEEEEESGDEEESEEDYDDDEDDDEEEEDESLNIYAEVGSGPVTIGSMLEHSNKVENFVAELQVMKEEMEKLDAELKKHSRIGNRTQIALVRQQMEALNLERRHVAARLVQFDELRQIEEDLLLVEAELEQFEDKFGDPEADKAQPEPEV